MFIFVFPLFWPTVFMKSKQLIIFVKNKIPGKVKTRLAAGIGLEKAMEVYDKLLQYTHNTTRCLDCDKNVYFSERMENDCLWADGNFRLSIQQGLNQGERMQHAFDHFFAEGAEKVCLIGADTFEIKAEIIKEAFDILQNHDVVLGPASDGGFYLLGMKELQPELFHHKNWSTEGILSQTLADIQLLNLKYALLPELQIINQKEDWLAHQRSADLKQ